MFRMFEMASIGTGFTGLPAKIYVSSKGNSRHSARIKVSTMYGNKLKKGTMFTMTISDIPKIIGDTGEISYQDVDKIIDFVVTNKEVLIQLWEDEITFDEFLPRLVLEK